MVKALYRVESLHNPLLRGQPLLLQPGGVLVRWPDRVPIPEVGDLVLSVAVTVHEAQRETVMTALFSPSALERCDAVRRLAQNKRHRKWLLSRMFSRSFVAQAIRSAERIEPEQREQMEAQGEDVILRRVFRAVQTPKARDPKQ